MNTRRVGVLLGLVVVFGTAATADDSPTLKYKLAKGDRILYRTKSEMKQTQTIAGQVIESETNAEAINSYTVDAIDEKGNYQLTIRGERLKMKGKFGGTDYAFDSQSSERDKSSVIGAEVTPLFERLSGSAYQATLGPDGDHLEVKGFGDLVRDLVQGHPIATQFASGGTDEAAREGLREYFPKLAKNALKPGDSWEVPVDLTIPNLGKTRGKSVYRYVGPDKVGERATAKIEVSTDATVELRIEMDGATVTGTINSTGASGTIQFDVAAGRVLTTQSAAPMTGSLNINANGMDIPLGLEQTIKSSTEYLEKLPE